MRNVYPTLKQILCEKQIKRSELAEAMFCCNETLNQKLMGKVKFHSEDLVLITDFLKLNPNEFYQIFYVEGKRVIYGDQN